MTTTRQTSRSLRGLFAAAHPGPAAAVTLLAGLLAVRIQLRPPQIALLLAAVVAGQLSVGWSNDLIDFARDRLVGRKDKPLVTGAVSEHVVRGACMVSVAATLPLSLALGWRAGVIHLVCVAAGWSYNLGMKATVLSWLPYAVAFGGMPVVISAAKVPWVLPPAWMPLASALLGIGAHLVNVLPDLEDDAKTSVRGLPHRLGARWTPLVASLVLVVGSIVIVFGAPITPQALGVIGLAVVAALAVLPVIGRGRTPFRAAVAIAVVDVGLLIWAR